MAIISCIRGGLGNQMFQYAMGQALATDLQEQLFLDTELYGTLTMHNGFELHRVFAISAPLATCSDLKASLGLRRNSVFRRLANKLPSLRGSRYILEEDFKGADHLEIGCDYYLSGYWQSEKFFSRHSEKIREDFQFKQQVSGLNADILREMSCSTSVSVHVRRGDYVTDPKTNAFHGACSVEYYEQSMAFVSGKVQNPKFFVFSDDVDWVRKNIEMPLETVFVDHNKGEDSFWDMYLMSQCQHNIVANSSFSWWGAWLNRSMNKIVVAPKAWFQAAPISSMEIIPETWHTF